MCTKIFCTVFPPVAAGHRNADGTSVYIEPKLCVKPASDGARDLPSLVWRAALIMISIFFPIKTHRNRQGDVWCRSYILSHLLYKMTSKISLNRWLKLLWNRPTIFLIPNFNVFVQGFRVSYDNNIVADRLIIYYTKHLHAWKIMKNIIPCEQWIRQSNPVFVKTSFVGADLFWHDIHILHSLHV